jgi:hypothetical protein
MYLAATDSRGVHTDAIGGVTYGHRQSIPPSLPGTIRRHEPSMTERE